MREILFRGKAINRDEGYHRTKYKNGDWVYGLITRLYDERFEDLPAEMTNTSGISGIEIDYKTIGQYTGLTDKNGKKIFEGDILRDDDSEENGVVLFFEGEYCVSFDNEFTYGFADIACSCYVNGNIHDNPELLKGGEDNA